MDRQTRNITLSGLFMAAGVLIPMLFHGLGLGPTFLPMFWPVALGGFVLAPPFAILTGLFTPLISTLVTGMPPPPILYKMIFELSVLGGVIAWLNTKTQWGVFWVVLAGLGAALAAGLGGSALIAPLLGLPPAFYAAATMLRGIPGLATMLIIIPLAVSRIRRSRILNWERG